MVRIYELPTFFLHFQIRYCKDTEPFIPCFHVLTSITSFQYLISSIFPNAFGTYFYASLSGLSWNTDTCRTEELRPGCFSIRPIMSCFHFFLSKRTVPDISYQKSWRHFPFLICSSNQRKKERKKERKKIILAIKKK